MLYKCANEACNTPFRRLREGKLFQVETEYLRGGVPSRVVPRKKESVAPRGALLALRRLLPFCHAYF
jgi:hypothetical protein